MKTVGYIPKDKPAADDKNGGNKANGNKPQSDKPAADDKNGGNKANGNKPQSDKPAADDKK